MSEGAGAFVTPARSLLKAGRRESWSEPFPVREACRVEPLVESAAMYPRLETLALSAQQSLWLAFRVFDPETRLRSDAAKAAGLERWADLLAHLAARGVEVRLLLTDFEPVMADELHAGSWASFRSLREARRRLGDSADRLQLIVIQHEGEIGWVWRQALRLPLRGKIRKLVGKLIEHAPDDGGFDVRPGLWRYLAWSAEKPSRFRPGPPPRLWPATYHQKFVVADSGLPGAAAVLGGLDLDERRWDDRRHSQRADQTWHDISSLLTGPAVADVAAHFIACWNRELPRFREIAREWQGPQGPELEIGRLDDIAAAEESDDAPEGDMPAAGTARVQIVRTRSRRSGSPLAFGPIPHVRELKAAHRSMILSARRLLYIEAQFLRARAAAGWIVAALKRHPELEVIILTANAPEEVAFEGQGDNPAHRHGEYLQARALRRILRAGGRDRVGVFTLVKQERVRADEQEFVDKRGTAYSSGLIHIHAKLLLADDRRCLLSSANINGRSFEWDTELGLIWEQGDGTIAQFRAKLWSDLSDGALDEDSSLATWRDLARSNAEAEPTDRRGFILPYQLGRTRRFGRPSWFVPDDLV